MLLKFGPITVHIVIEIIDRRSFGPEPGLQMPGGERFDHLLPPPVPPSRPVQQARPAPPVYSPPPARPAPRKFRLMGYEDVDLVELSDEEW